MKWILKYLKGTADVGLVYGRDQGKHVDVDCFMNANYAKDPNKGRSITGYVFMVHGCVVSWKATLQHVALSTTEAEYMVPTKVVKESIWLKGLLIELGKKPKIVESRNIEMAKIGMKDNAADAFTKMAPRPKFKYCMKILDVRQVIRLLCLGNFELESALGRDLHPSSLFEMRGEETENLIIQEGAAKPSSTNIFSTVSTPAKASSTNLVNTVSIPVSTASPYEGLSLFDPTNPEEDDSEIPPLEDIYQNTTDGIFTTSSYDDEGAVADFTNLETVVNVSPIPTSRIHSSHPTTLILGDPTSAVQTRSKLHKSSGAHAFVSYVQKQRRNNHKDFQHCLFACFLSQHEPKKILEALEDKSWVDAMQEELLQFQIQKVWVLVELPYGKKAIVTQGHRQEEGIDYDDVFAPVARIEAIRIFLAFALYMGFIVYQMDVKSAFLYGKIDKENGYRRVKQKADGIFISQDKYVAKILKKFDFANVKTVSTPIETQKPLVKDEEASDVDVHLYRSMIGSLMYLTASRPDIMFAVCACSRFQVTPKSSHLSVVKRIFRYLKGKPKLGLWYHRVSSFDLESYSYSDYAGANLDRKSTTRGYQFLGRRLISWQWQTADH
ncbi:ribonuclease H-like domain-containing protein [Tanacetum coccineum]